MATGIPTNKQGRKTEVLNLKNSKITCDDLDDYPLGIYAGFGGQFQGQKWPFICGGWDESYPRNECYEIGTNQFLGYLNQSREYSSVIPLQNNSAFWILGGDFGFKSDLKTTEILSDNGIEPHFDLPFTFSQGCVTRFDLESFILIGGYQNGQEPFLGSKNTWLVNLESMDTWIMGPTLNYSRYDHGCGTFNGLIAVLGGFPFPDSLTSVELLDISSPDNEFMKGISF